MAEFCSALGADILADCINRPVAGVEQKLVLFPLDTLTTYTQTDGLATAMTLSAAGFVIDGINDVLRFENSFVRPAESQAGFKHSLPGIIIRNISVATRNEINKLLVGGKKYAAVLERRAKGAAKADAFLVFGPTYGLEVPDGGFVDNSNENDGMMVLTLTSPDFAKEPRVPDVLLLTDYATTKTASDAGFAPPP